MPAKKITKMALLTAIALIIHIVEAQIPNPFPIQGVKLGLANIVTVYAMFTIGPGGTFLVLISRIFLGSMFSGSGVSLIYSLSGGLFCYLSMLCLRRFLKPEQIWVSSVIGAVFHNLGQILAAVAITKTPGIAVYFPLLMFSGILAGLFTGIAAQSLINRMKKEDRNP